MGLKTYRTKRNFRRTAEPKGKTRPSPKRGHKYLIQKHDATRLHYDFRLELDGVLKSWAIPKGPSADPNTRRLAVHVEDHPVEYGKFEGTIPEGEYGGGTVMLWDTGTWEPLEDDPARTLDKGKLKFVVHGKRLQGAWMLVRMGGDAGEDGKNWLLIKEKDEYATPGKPEGLIEEYDDSVKSGRTMSEIGGEQAARKLAKKSQSRSRKLKRPVANRTARTRRKAKLALAEIEGGKPRKMPAELSPELATLVDAPPQGDDWIHEIKFDGYRILAFIKENSVKLMSRRGKDWTHTFQPIADELASLALPPGIYDGELVALTKDGDMTFQALQNVVKHGASANLIYYLFDLPYCDGYDLTRASLLDRKKVLHGILGDAGEGDRVRYCDHVVGEGAELYEHACRMTLEGIIAKRANSIYQQRRTHDWLKIKCIKRQEFVIGGFTAPGGSREYFGALLLGYHKNGELKYCGKVGTGFDQQTLADVYGVLKKLKIDKPPFDILRSEARGATWVKPVQLAEVEFTEWTDDGRLRHPSFHGLRNDKPAKAIVKEEPEMTKKIEKEKPAARRAPTSRSANQNGSGTVAGQRLTHPDRVLYPGEGITKQALAEYYERIQEWVLPHVVDRPLSIVRCPDGATKQCFYQKHKTENMPDSIDAVPIKEKSSTSEYLVIRDLAGLIGCVQIGALEIHTWGCRTDKIEFPDRIVFDLDPDPGVTWEFVKKATADLRAILEAAGFECFLKTSGGKGLHVVVPLARRNTWDEVKGFTQAIAQGMAQSAPKQYIATMSKAKRKGKIFVDYLRNSRGQTFIAPYSSRAREGAAVAAPIRWDELKKLQSAKVFTVENIPQRLERMKKDPWKEIDSVRQSISKSLLKSLNVDV